MSAAIFKTASHNPPHLFVADTFYMLTGAIYGKAPLMHSVQRKMEWRDAFSESAKIYKWQIIAWVVLHNHYHAIVQSPQDASTLSKFVNSYHEYTSRKWNNEDEVSGRKVWWNYWDTCIRSERDYHNRLRYVFWNSVKHGLAETPEDYIFSNYRELVGHLPDLDLKIAEVSDVPEF